ncbi:MAG: hypothetical protein JXC32_10570 [Anaerolineae bacterium]|nr:hypothetical protein [Anaerolineae bacterium]
MTSRAWTIYIAQDKHLDYNWCGAPAEIETRMAALVDYYLEETAATGGRWNLDSTIWADVYERQRGPEGANRLLQAIREGRIGYAANHSVLLWGLLSTELAVRACYGALPIEAAVEQPIRTALIMENHGLPWGTATILTEAGLPNLGRGIYSLRAESYVTDREPLPLFWWVAPNHQKVLVRWDLYKETRRWGGYAEAYALSEIAGETWDAFHLHDFDDRNTDEVYQQRVDYIEQTVVRYEGYGDAYPISSILLLGTGWDNWTRTPDITRFIQRFNAEYPDNIRLVDARYDQFFAAARAEIEDRALTLPALSGTFGICWEEWAAHLAALTADFREAERLLRWAEADHALDVVTGQEDATGAMALRRGVEALLRFAEHDFGGTDRTRAAISAGVRAAATTEALSIARALAPVSVSGTAPQLTSPEAEACTFDWRGGRIRFDPNLAAVASLIDREGHEWVPQQSGILLGDFVHTRYSPDLPQERVLPEPRLRKPGTQVNAVRCERGLEGVAVETLGTRWGFDWSTRWFFHTPHPWIDVTYDLENGWTEDPQAVQFAFPLSLASPIYHYDTAGAIAVAGPVSQGGHDLPGANPSLYAAQTFAAASDEAHTALLVTPDAHLVQFGPQAVEMLGVNGAVLPAQMVSMPMMNITRNDWQFGQGGARRWRFRYRLVLLDGPFQLLQALRATQQFAVPPFLQVPGLDPALAGLEDLDIIFPGGPVLAFKAAQDGQRLILRLWNVLERPVAGSMKLPIGYNRGDLCDALERPQRGLAVENGRVAFDAGAGALITLALLPG